MPTRKCQKCCFSPSPLKGVSKREARTTCGDNLSKYDLSVTRDFRCPSFLGSADVSVSVSAPSDLRSIYELSARLGEDRFGHVSKKGGSTSDAMVEPLRRGRSVCIFGDLSAFRFLSSRGLTKTN